VDCIPRCPGCITSRDNVTLASLYIAARHELTHVHSVIASTIPLLLLLTVQLDEQLVKPRAVYSLTNSITRYCDQASLLSLPGGIAIRRVCLLVGWFVRLLTRVGPYLENGLR